MLYLELSRFLKIDINDDLLHAGKYARRSPLAKSDEFLRKRRQYVDDPGHRERRIASLVADNRLVRHQLRQEIRNRIRDPDAHRHFERSDRRLRVQSLPPVQAAVESIFQKTIRSVLSMGPHFDTVWRRMLYGDHHWPAKFLQMGDREPHTRSHREPL